MSPLIGSCVDRLHLLPKLAHTLRCTARSLLITIDPARREGSAVSSITPAVALRIDQHHDRALRSFLHCKIATAEGRS